MTAKKKKAHVAERLLPLLAKRLREVHREKSPDVGFDYNHWWYTPLTGCGTFACAGGHACLMREFQKRGLRINYHTGIMTRKTGRTATHGNNVAALASTLDIDYWHARFLFTPGVECPWGKRRSPPEGANALQVARHIERYVAERGWEKLS